mgnify:CR=1 FL=1
MDPHKRLPERAFTTEKLFIDRGFSIFSKFSLVNELLSIFQHSYGLTCVCRELDIGELPQEVSTVVKQLTGRKVKKEDTMASQGKLSTVVCSLLMI